MVSQFEVIGKRLPRLDGFDKVTGRAVYGPDIKLPRMLIGKILRSPHPHARIANIDVSRAAKLTGVKAVLTSADTPKIKFGFFKHHDPKFGDCEPLKTDKVRCVGDEVAAVAAVDEDIAQEALSLIRMEYELLPAVFDPQQALAPDAPLVHEEKGSNLLDTLSTGGGDVEQGFRKADLVLEGTFTTQATHPCSMEPKQAVASFSSSGALTFYSSTQMPFFMRRDLADVLGIKESQIKVIKTTMGGHFGSRMEMHPLDPICALLAKAADRAVKIVHSRNEEFIASRFRHPVTIQSKMGATKEGKIVAAENQLIMDSGAYCSQSPGVIAVAGTSGMMTYAIPNIHFQGKIVYTNNPYAGSFRGYGNPQGHFATDSMVDRLADELSIDPVELRRINAWTAGDVTPLGRKIVSCGFKECLEVVGRWIGRTESKAPWQGTGIAGLFHAGGGARFHGDNDGCGAFVKIEEDGNALLITGAQEIGQGGITVLAQIVAEELGLPLTAVRVVNDDTDVVPWDLGCHASRTTFVGGNAALAAAREAKKTILNIAAEKLEVSPDDLIIKQGKISVIGSPEKNITVAEAARCNHYRSGGSTVIGAAFYDPPSQVIVEGRGNTSATYAFGFQAAWVKVDPETGEVRLIKLAAAHDLGRVINPMLAEGQLEGALCQGMGFSLGEELIFDNGSIVNASFMDYLIPTACDLPIIEVALIESIDPLGPFGAKGFGESGLVPTAPAIANALTRAIGIRIGDLPFTSEKVWRAIKAKDRLQPGA